MRIVALDGLRGLCVLAVLLYHADTPLVRGGFLGVDGFFVLSGYLITTLLLREHARTGRIDLAAFYTRRALRLLPALFIVTGAVAVWLFLTRPPAAVLDANVRGVWASLAYVANWVTIFSPTGHGNDLGVLGHTWSLAIEEQFYILWPPVLIWLLRRSPRRVPWALGIGAIAAATLRYTLLTLGGSSPNVGRLYNGTDTRADSILIGCLLAALLSAGILRPSPRITRYAVCFAVPPLAFMWSSMYSDTVFLYQFGFTLDALLFAAVVLHLHASPEGRVARALSWRPLVAVGVVSYGLYLWHVPIYEWLPAHDWTDWPMQAARLAVLAGAVVLSWRYVEQPLLRLKSALRSPVPGRAYPTHTT